MLQKRTRIRSELIKVSSRQDLNIEINDNTEYKSLLTKFTRWIEEVDIITIFMQRNYIILEECRSTLYLFSEKVENNKRYWISIIRMSI